MESALLSEVVKSLPKPFVSEVLRVTEWVYDEAYNSAFNHPLMGRPESEYLYPHMRRALMESKLREVANSLGLSTKVCTNFARNHEFTEIQAGRLVLTCSHKTGEDWQMLRSSYFRQKNATLNSLLSQMEFDSAGFEVFSENDDAGLLNAVIYHGTDLREKNKVGYVRIGFPSPCNSRWSARFDLYEILGSYPAVVAQSEDDEIIVRWKSKARILEA